MRVNVVIKRLQRTYALEDATMTMHFIMKTEAVVKNIEEKLEE